MSNASYQRSAPDSRKCSSVMADPTAFAKKIDYVKKTAISEDLSGRRIVMQDDGVGVAVYDLPPETHVGIVIGSNDSLYQTSLTNWPIPSTVIVRQTTSIHWPNFSKKLCLWIKTYWSIGLLLLRSNAVNSSRPCGGEKYRPSFGIKLAFNRGMAYPYALQLRNSRNTLCFNKLLSERSMEGAMQSFSKL